MDVEDFPPPPPEMLADSVPFADEDDGEAFDFDDSGDDVVPEADRLPPAPPVPPAPSSGDGLLASLPDPPAPSPTPITAPLSVDTSAATAEGEGSSAPEGAADTESDLPPPPPPPLTGDAETDPAQTDPSIDEPPPPQAVPRTSSQGKVNPYSVIDINPLQLQQIEKQHGPSSPTSSQMEPREREEEAHDVDTSPAGVTSGYSVPVPCGYATPSGVPLITPAYTTPVIIRHLSMDEDVTVIGTGSTSVDSVFSEEYPPIKEEDALAKWASDPANTAWMDNPDEVIYDDVPRENSDSNTDPDEMIYDDVELGEEGGCNSSLDNGWSSSEFESYEEASDGEGHLENGLPHAFMRGKPPQRKTHLSQDLTRLKEHYEKKMKDLMANTVGTVELQQLKQKHEQKMQKLVKAAKDGTKDGLEKTKAAVKKGRSFIKTKSFCQERKSACFEDEESELFIEVDCFNVEPVLCEAPEGLSQQQLVRRCILGSILESEKNYLDAMKRILEQYEKPLSQMEPRLLSDRKLKMTFYRVREILQCHFLFQIALASRVAEWDSLEMIGDVFVASFSKSMVLDAYSEYVNNFSNAMAVVRKTCAAKPGFLEFLKHRQETSSDRMTLYGLMMKPIQRFPQFILLLQDMLKNTPVGHADRLPLQMALTELETLAEKLNEKKREADQRCEIRHIAKAMNERYLNKLLSNGSRHLIRSDDMVETVYNERGEIIKTKERRLFLLNDVLMCATPNIRCQDGSGSGNGNAPLDQKFLLKWSVPLGFVEVLEFGSSEDMADSSRYQAPHSGEKVVINAKPNKLYMGPGQLYQDLQNLIHDLSLVNQISSMIGSLKGNYQNVNPAVAQDWVSGLQRLILKKEEEIRAADRCRIQLQLPGKQDKSGKPTYFSAVFNTLSPAIKQSWISNLQMAKLALEEDNLQGWLFAEDDGNQIKKQKHPLLLRQMPVVMSKLQEFKVECAVHNPEPHINTESTADTPVVGHGCVWVASCTNQMGQIAIVAMQNSSPKVTECFNVESRILCMAFVPAEQPQENGEKVPENNHVPAAKASDTPSVCLGMEEGSIIVYKSSQRSKKVRLQHFFTPDKSTVTSLVYRRPCLYAGLVSGAVAVYSRSQDGLWNCDKPKVLKLGVLPVKAMLAVEEHLWASSGGQVFIIGTHTHSVERQLEAHQEEGMVVSHMVVAGVGIWIAFSSGSALRLFHTETLEHLQDINIATPVHNVLPGNQRVSVSSLLVCHGLLLVGTNLGVTVALSVPRLQGIPKVTGRGMVSLHAHNGPVKFLTVAAAVCNRSSGQPSSGPPSSTPPTPVQPAGTEAVENAPPPSDSAPAPPPGRSVWLGEAGCTTMALQDSVSSSSCGSLAPSQGSLEHGPEDGALYDVLHDPANQQRGRRSSKVDVSSLLVVSGGLGHRRVNKKTKQSRHEDTTSTIMIWQIPLLNM
ncbi:rho guanine nucleotide exchange factor 10 isoform X1 [Scophthalmus maximus]|uniref:rho guanine nucleotide exchange factor 10 isoform X1 n=1 Tax=Scophthalmus maximus TaxID=52904 RepID=UPI001FA925D7|nr:rho guanine nucleotide exchange factor 10 isoform X1 [Scophthalmus maximus]XP_047193659.1 rho guanine nucleotide exchange factor 10 isoform X1 [Scophthalmus maximus]